MYSVLDFDYSLPDELIAQFPTSARTDSRLLILPDNTDADIIHAQFTDFIDIVRAGDLVIFNDTKVIPARLHGCKESGGKIECLIERVLTDHTALAHIRSSHAPKAGATLRFENAFCATVLDRQDALFILEFSPEKTVLAWLDQYGKLPLPPYITRDVKSDDLNRYQTVYAEKLGAVAAPTAGLHFDENTLQQLRDKKVDIGLVTLHVGAGTFQPVRVEKLSDHVMHKERVTVSEKLCAQIEACHARSGRVIAIGTTVVRSLESAAISGKIAPFSGETDIFITPGFQFHVVDILFTNFHLPKSTLLMLVCAFAGFDRVINAYHEAVEKKYRFFSYGDAMLVFKKGVSDRSASRQGARKSR
jgi:S-adenosylmethionine:tRNA ribosyltransferase-isomerase